VTPDAVAALAQDIAAGSLSVDNPAVADVTVADFILDGRPFDADVVDALVDVGINRAIEGASTLTATVTDTDLKLLNSPVLAKAVDLWLDDLAFRLADIDLADDDGGPELVLVLEARAVAKLREFDEPMAASRDDKTRAEFIKAMCDEAGVPFVCPQLHKRQPIKKKTDRESRRKRDERRDPGIKATAALTVGGAPADSGQRQNMERVLDVAKSHDADELATMALVEACIVEPGKTATRGFTNPPDGDGTSSGILQLLAETAAGLGIDPRDVEACAAAFLTKGFFGNGGAIALAKKHPDWTAGQIAQAVQGSQFPNRYNVWRDEAEKILKAYGHGDVFAGAVVDEYAVPFMFRRGSEDGTTKEDSWTCMRRLAGEVNWRLWEDAGTVYFMTDDDILRSRVRHTIKPGAEGVDSVTGRISTRKPLQEVTVACHARRWAAPPATVVEMEGYGSKYDGRWIVATINRPSVFATATTITLHRRQKLKLEPAHDTRARRSTGGASQVVGNTVAGGTLRDRVVAAAQRAADLSKAHPDYYHYLAGGTWKNDLFLRDAPGERSDCSSFVIQCYAKAGCKLPAALKGQGNTESLAAVGRKVATPKPGDICLYGSAPKYHHVELYVGSGKTIGHGSAPVDADTPRNPALGAFAGYFTFDFLDDDVRQPKANPNLAPDVNGQTRPT
jgi:cell wall-associated NlpC family hydrolase